jgi:hypothetical protein
MFSSLTFEDGARDEVLEPDPVEGLALARLDELILDDDVGVPVDLDLQPLPELTGGILAHGSSYEWPRVRVVRPSPASARGAWQGE